MILCSTDFCATWFKFLTQQAVSSTELIITYLYNSAIWSLLHWLLPCLWTSLAPPTPSEVTGLVTNVSTVRVTWQWTSSDPAPYCFNTTSVISRPEGGEESFLQLSDPAATEATLTDLQCSTNYSISVHTSSGSTDTRSAHRTVALPARGNYNISVVFFIWHCNVCFVSWWWAVHTLLFCFLTSDIHLFTLLTLYPLSPTHSLWGHCRGHKCLNSESNMAVD